MMEKNYVKVIKLIKELYPDGIAPYEYTEVAKKISDLFLVTMTVEENVNETQVEFNKPYERFCDPFSIEISKEELLEKLRKELEKIIVVNSYLDEDGGEFICSTPLLGEEVSVMWSKSRNYVIVCGPTGDKRLPAEIYYIEDDHFISKVAGDVRERLTMSRGCNR